MRYEALNPCFTYCKLILFIDDSLCINSSGLYGGQKVESSEPIYFWYSIPFLTMKNKIMKKIEKFKDWHLNFVDKQV